MPPKLRVVGANPFASEDDVRELARVKLESSGLTLEDAEGLGMEWLSAGETAALHETHWPLPALRIPYFSPREPNEPLRPGVDWPGFYRVRALREPTPKDKTFKKYLQPPDSSVAAYMPRTEPWAAIMDDYKRSIIITEGELKAACTCKFGLPTIGLGGVYSFRAVRAGHMLLPELAAFVWPRREVFIIFDSDARRNENVCRALWELAEELLSRGARPRTVILPDDGTEKYGLDDLLVKEGRSALDKLLLDSDPLTMAETLWNLNQEYAYIEEPGLIVKQTTGFLMKPEAFKNHAITKTYMENRLLPNGSISRLKVSAAPAWVGWGLRTTARAISFMPGKTPKAIVEDEGVKYFNTWPGWWAEPLKKDVRLFKQLLDHLFEGARPEAKAYFLQWLAWPVVHPGSKMLVSAVCFGTEQGTGKSLIGVTMGKIYGPSNYTMITQENMESSFNNWANSRQFVMVDDVTATDRRRDIDRLKAMITRETVWINIKHVPEYSVADCTNFYFNSNRHDALFLDGNDRRFFVHEVLAKRLTDDFAQNYDAWLHGPDCGAAVHYFLKNEVDLTGFNPNAAPPMTAAKQKMIGLARTDIEDWLARLLESPDDYLKLGDIPMRGDMFTLSEVRACFETYQGKPLELSQLSQIGLSRKLHSQGVRQLEDGKNVYVPGRKLDRYWILRNREKWHKASLDAAKRHLGEIAALNRFKG